MGGPDMGALVAAIMRTGVVGLMAAVAAAGTAAAQDPGQDRQGVLLDRLRQDCGSCHGLTMKGGLGPALLPEAIAERSDDVLIETILEGRKGTPMPPWAFEISRPEAAWLVRELRKGLDDGQ